MSEVVLFEVDRGVATVTLNRPDRLNAWTGELEHAYFAALDECAARDDVRAVVVTGAGRGFCAGADMDDLEAIGSNGGRGAQHDRRPQTFPLTVPKPIVAAINGACAGIGLVQALMCKVRFPNPEAKSTTAFPRRGLVAEHGISWILPRLVGPARALDLLLSGRVVLADEAERLGLVNAVHAPDELLDRTLDYARELATWSSPASMAVMKRQVYEHLEARCGPALEESNALMLESFTRADFGEGVASFVEGRSPAFNGLAGGLPPQDG